MDCAEFKLLNDVAGQHAIECLKNHPYFYHRHSLLKWDDVKIAE